MKQIIKESIALERGNQSALNKAVKKFKKGKGKFAKIDDGEATGTELGRIIMLKHIPHGFYEDEIKSYFSQFGNVLRVRVARSLKTGKSRGYAYVEFEFEEVAKIAAEAMNNYLMFERLIKCHVLPSTVNRRKVFRNSYITEHKNPKVIARKKRLEEQERILSSEEENEILQQRLNKLAEQNKKFAELGIDYHYEPAEKKSNIEGPSTKLENKSSSQKHEEEEIFTPVSSNEKRKKAKSPAKTDVDNILNLSSASPKIAKRKSDGLQQHTPIISGGKKQAKKEKSPANTLESPKITPKLLKRKSDTVPEQPAKIKDDVSPKMLKRQIEGPQQQQHQTPRSSNEKQGKKAKSPAIASESPKLLKRKSDIVQEQPAKVKDHVSPKMLKRQSGGPQQQKTPDNSSIEKQGKKGKSPGKVPENHSELTRLSPVSPKMLKRQSGGPQQQQTPRSSNEKQGKKAKSPAITSESPKLLKRKSDTVQEHAPTINDHVSPKMLKRQSGGPQLQQTPRNSPNEKQGKKAKSPGKIKGNHSELPRISPKMLRSRKTEVIQEATPARKEQTPAKAKASKNASELPRISPKMLRSRKSEGPKQQQTPVVSATEKQVAKAKTPAKAKSSASSELPKISPKLLRSRKSEAATLTPVKDKSTPAKAKKAGRKSVF